MFDTLNERFRFTIDVAAQKHNTKLPRYFAPPGTTTLGCMWRAECPPNCRCPHEEGQPIGEDGLSQSWAGERVWCNPPYSNIEPWVEKAWQSSADLVVMLLPANRTEQGWWQRHVEQQRHEGRLRVEFLPGRPRFICVGETEVLPNQRPPFGCCLLIWDS